MATPAEDQGAPTENPETVAVQGAGEGSQESTQVPVETPENTPEGNIDPAVEPQRPATPEQSGSSPASLPLRPAQPQTPAPAVTNGTLSFPYGSYTGENPMAAGQFTSPPPIPSSIHPSRPLPVII